MHQALEGAVLRALRRQDSLAVAVSGGLDSSILAAMIAQHADVTVQLVTVSVPGAVDAPRARLLAEHLRLPLAEIVLNQAKVEALLPEVVPLIGASPVDPERAAEWDVPPGTPFVSPVRTAWEIPIFVAAAEAKRHAKRLVVGQGADEWFGGYQRYVGLEGDAFLAAVERDRTLLDQEILPIERRIAEHHGIQLHYPYLDIGVRSAARRTPRSALVAGTDRKRVLREVADHLGLPEAIVNVPKTAAQYGSGVAKLLAELAEKAGLHQNEYLTGFLRPEGSESSIPSARSA